MFGILCCIFVLHVLYSNEGKAREAAYPQTMVDLTSYEVSRHYCE